jgi:16S rRNA (cytidine1402-2'-O)-methyltransferase
LSVLYVVATPIGNLGDISRRACQILSEVDLIAAEDTRRTKRLLDDIGITTKLTSYHVHNEARTTEALMLQLENGADIALVSDAGTPLISDPGFLLVKEALFRGISVVPIPGPSAVTTALSVAGIPTTRFIFEGFAPAKSTGRKAFFETFVRESRTIVYFEAPHRIAKSLSDLG